MGDGLDLRHDFEPDFRNKNQSQVYMTELITASVQDWITSVVQNNPDQPSFAYVAHQAVHAPMQAPMYTIEVKTGFQNLYISLVTACTRDKAAGFRTKILPNEGPSSLPPARASAKRTSPPATLYAACSAA